MCGIVAIINKKEKVKSKLLNAIKHLEYRGYDSSGVAILDNKKFEICKTVGKVKNLEEKIDSIGDGNIGIVHTRWATHGGVVEDNAHPHNSYDNKISLVHNGIIENYKELKDKLLEEGYKFKGDTDSEVLVNVMAYNYSKSKDIEKAFFETLKQVEGSYGLAMMCVDSEKIFVAKLGSPILLGVGEDCFMAGSSLMAFSGITNKIIQLQDGEKAILSFDGYKIYDYNDKEIKKNIETVEMNEMTADKGKYEHFMLKEIYEQPDAIKRTLGEYIDGDKILLPAFDFPLKDIEYLTIVACGTSYYAGCVAKYFIEDLTGINVNVDIASEFIYRKAPLPKNGVALFISQSGETADTISALKYCKEHKQKIISIVNVFFSTIANLSNTVLKTFSGTEVGVASTKAFSNQVMVLYLLALQIAKEKNRLSLKEFERKLNAVKETPNVLKSALADENVNDVKEIAKELSKAEHLIYIGRGIYYPLTMEGALKIKEISYIHTQSVASGELKHGSIALIDKNTYVVALNNSNVLFDKNTSSIEQVIARNGKVILICDRDGIDKLENKVYKSIEIPYSQEEINIIMSVIPAIQLLAYYTALNKGLDIDKPRNLAKSVTVE